MNNISILGRVGKDVELSFGAGSGTAIAKFSVGVRRRFKKEETDWFNCVAFGKTAEIINQYVKKGDQIEITGEMQFGSYNDKDGNKRRSDNLVVSSFDFVGGRKENNNGNSEDMNFTPEDNSDMPF